MEVVLVSEEGIITLTGALLMFFGVWMLTSVILMGLTGYVGLSTVMGGFLSVFIVLVVVLVHNVDVEEGEPVELESSPPIELVIKDGNLKFMRGDVELVLEEEDGKLRVVEKEDLGRDLTQEELKALKELLKEEG